ncbi:MAG: glycosyltransferase family 2 protein [Legionella sp.]|nr:MAG: glycosyltransferase family 2 protein [Legionella sp.]
MTAYTAVNKEKVVIIIPTYNEASVIKNTLTKLFEAVQDLAHFDAHVLVFDSASTDDTQQMVSHLQAYYPQLHLQKEAQKSGLGSAYLQAMNYALHTMQADIIIEFDADLSHQPKYIAPMLELLKTKDCVVGSRYILGGSIPANWAWHRKLFSVLGNYVARSVLTHKYKDFTSGFRATRRQSLLKILPEKFLSANYAYKLHLLWLLHKSKAKIVEYPIEFIDRAFGESKLPKNSIIDSLRVVFTLRYYELKRYLSMCLVGSIGMTVQFITYNGLRPFLTPFNATQIAVLIAIINNFILNNRFTFKSTSVNNQPITIKKLMSFTLYSLLVIYLQSGWMWLGIHYLGTGALQENAMIITGSGLISLLNYFTYSRHIWAERLASS